MTDTYLTWATRHAPQTFTPKVLSALAALGNFPQNPNAGVPSSPRMIPGILPHLMQYPPMGIPTAKALDAYECWVNEEEQRHLPNGPPDPVFYDWQTPLLKAAWPLNESGKPVPITLWDSQHLVVDQLLAGAFAAPTAAVRKRCAIQADRLRTAVYATVLDPVKVTKQGQALSGNARAAGWTLSFAVRMLRALPNGQDVAVLSTLVDGLWDLTQAQGNDPAVIVNPADQAQDPLHDDHGGDGWTLWMILGPLLRGLCEAREFDPTNAHLNALIMSTLNLAEDAFAVGKAHYGIDGKLPDAMDPVRPPFFQKGSTMPGWAITGLREADAQGLLTSDLKAQAVALCNTTGYLDDTKVVPGMDQKNLGLVLLRLGWIGPKA